MQFKTLRDAPILELRLFAAENPFARLEAAQALLAAFDGAGPLRPDEALGKFRGPFDPRKLAQQLVKANAKPSALLVSVDLARKDPELRYAIMVSPEDGDFSLRAYFLRSLFADDVARDHLLDLVRALASAVGATFGRAHDDADLQLADAGREFTSAPARIEDVYWLNLWGPDLVDRAGRERVLSTPAHLVESLPGGRVLLLTRPTPVDFAAPEARRAQARALAHLDPARSEEEIDDELLARSRKLAPVETSWDPDIADLLELTLQDVMKSERPGESEKLNAYRSPPVTEVRDEPLPADTAAASAIDSYDDAAEQLVALLRKDIPEVESMEPSTLPRIDHHLWHFNFAEDYERKDVDEDLVPALGAYVGQMIVERLGGTWLPRRNRDETQVVVGGKAFLPFLRARRALATRQGQIDHSMTKFFREAERAKK
jgi:hypothetical protein